MAGYARVAARGAARALRAQKQARGAAKAQAAGLPPPAMPSDSFMGPMAAGAMAQSFSQVASGFAAATSGGRPFRWQQEVGAASTAVAAGVGLAIGGPIGGMAAAAISVTGQVFQSWWQGGVNLGEQQQMAAFALGMPSSALSTAAAALGNIYGPYKGGTGFFKDAGGYSALAQMGSYAGGGLGFGQIQTMAGNMIRQFGDPAGPAFQAASSAQSAISVDPYLSSQFGAGPLGAASAASRSSMSIGIGGVSQAFDQLGPMGAFLAVNAAGSDSDKNLLRRVARADRASQVSTQSRQNIADIGGMNIAAQQTTGSRDRIMSAYGLAATAEDDDAAAWGDAERLAIHEGGPFEAVKVTTARKARTAAKVAAAQFRLGRQTTGPSGDWAADTMQYQTDEAMAMSNPLTGFVSPATRYRLMGQYGARLAQLDADLKGASPMQREAVRAGQMNERSSLQLQRQQEQNALQYGLVGQFLDLSAGQPSGFQALGLQAMSLAVLQRHDPGIAPAFGGTGASVGGATSVHPDVLRLLTRIANALEGGRPGVSAGGPSSVYALAQDRARR